jgi:sRNA-binding protein
MWVAMRSRNQRSWLMTTAQPGELEQGVLERAQRVDVEVVGGLVEQQHVAALPQQLGEVHAVALAAREVAHRFCWSLPAKLKPPTYAREFTSRLPTA